MSYATVRQALVAYFASIAGIQTMYRDSPWFLDQAQWGLEADKQWGAVAFLHIDRSSESRITLPAGTGSKEIEYVVSLVVQYQYLIPSILGNGLREDDWVVGLDTIIDTVKARLRADQTAGTGLGGVIFQVGENPSDITVDQDLPILDVGRVYSLTRVEFNVTEIITA